MIRALISGTAVLSALLLFSQHSKADAIEGLSFLTVESSWTALANASPEDIGVTRTTAPSSFNAFASIDDPDAAVVISDSMVQVGNSATDPVTPFITSAHERVDRVDPTEFSQAQRRLERTRPFAPNPDFLVDFVTGPEETEEVGLAQVRIGQPAVAADSQSFHSFSTTIGFENLTREEIGFSLIVSLDADVTARFGGPDGFARASVTREYVLSGMLEDSAPIIVEETAETLNEIGSGASASFLFGATADDDGVFFTTTASAVGSDVFTEATSRVFRRFTLLFAVAPGETVLLTESLRQTSMVEYRPIASVSASSGPAALVSAFALLALSLLSGKRRACLAS